MSGVSVERISQEHNVWPLSRRGLSVGSSSPKVQRVHTGTTRGSKTPDDDSRASSAALGNVERYLALQCSGKTGEEVEMVDHKAEFQGEGALQKMDRKGDQSFKPLHGD